MATLVDYSDLDFAPIADEQYRDNLYHQIRLPNLPDDLTVEDLEGILDNRALAPKLPKKLKGEIAPTVLEVLPADIQWKIWRVFYSTFVMPELFASQKFIWENPSERLKILCQDKGVIQNGIRNGVTFSYSGLDEMIEYENMWAWNYCMQGHCTNCVVHGFPCSNLVVFGFNNLNIDSLWKANFTIG
jgi:hypothetical protein